MDHEGRTEDKRDHPFSSDESDNAIGEEEEGGKDKFIAKRQKKI